MSCRMGAEARLDAAVERIGENGSTRESPRWHAYRRALKALLRERAEAAVAEYREFTEDRGDVADGCNVDRIRAAVRCRRGSAWPALQRKVTKP